MTAFEPNIMMACPVVVTSVVTMSIKPNFHNFHANIFTTTPPPSSNTHSHRKACKFSVFSFLPVSKKKTPSVKNICLPPKPESKFGKIGFESKHHGRKTCYWVLISGQIRWRACSVVEFVRKSWRFPHRHRSLAVQCIIFMVLAISILFGCIVIKVMGWGENSILQNHPKPSRPPPKTTT